MNVASPSLRVAELRTTLAHLERELAAASLSAARRKSIESDLRQILDELGLLVGKLDPIGEPGSVFDPSNPKIVGRFVSLALVAQMRRPLAEIPRTYGSGVYAIYYKGAFPLPEPTSVHLGTRSILEGRGPPIRSKTPKQSVRSGLN